MTLKEKIKTIFFALKDNSRTILLDYPNIPKPFYTKQNPHTLLKAIIDSEKKSYEMLLEKVLLYKNFLFSIKDISNKVNDEEPNWNAGHLPGLDIIMIYTLIAEYKPKRYVEIGSGTSTKVVYKAKNENNLSTQIISIDPNPRLEIDKLCTEVHRKYVHEININFFKQLSAGDILFLDGSHMLLPNSDVQYFFMEILPVLQKGIVIHIHDIYLPYDYPQFMCNRYYNEQYILASTLLANSNTYKIICPNYYIFETEELHSILNPLWKNEVFDNVEKHGGSFWFKKL